MTECTHGAEPPSQPDGPPSYRLLRALLSNSLTHTGPLCSSSQARSPTNIASFHPAAAHLASRIKPLPMQQTKRVTTEKDVPGPRGPSPQSSCGSEARVATKDQKGHGQSSEEPEGAPAHAQRKSPVSF